MLSEIYNNEILSLYSDLRLNKLMVKKFSLKKSQKNFNLISPI